MFIGAGAVFGSITMFIDPTGQTTGMSGLLPGLQKLPFSDILFQNLIFSGIALLIVNGISNLVAALLLIHKKYTGAVLGCVFGITLMLWISIQFFIFESNILSNSYFIFGILQAITGFATIVFYRQEHFVVNENDYPNVGTNQKTLVVYFSRMGYVKKLAYEKAQQTGANIFEITTHERTKGTLGFLWCGRFGMHRWDMPIDKLPEDIASYEKIIICTPVWVFSLSAPIRAFCHEIADKGIKNFEYVICHFSPGKYKNVEKEMNDILGVEAEEVNNVICRIGKYKNK